MSTKYLELRLAQKMDTSSLALVTQISASFSRLDSMNTINITMRMYRKSCRNVIVSNTDDPRFASWRACIWSKWRHGYILASA